MLNVNCEGLMNTVSCAEPADIGFCGLFALHKT